MKKSWLVAVTAGVVTATTFVEAQSLAGDASRGATLYEDKCGACHSLDANRVGPAHRGVYGRKAGAAPGFAYSQGLKASRVVWKEATLDKWLTNPQAFIGGARMAFRLSDPQQRADVIAFLKRESGAPRP
jgi:cytochrome c